VVRPGRLVVLRKEDGRSAAWLVDPDERTIQRATEPGDDLTLVAAAPGGDRLAYLTVDADQRWSLWSVSTDGGARQAIRPSQDGFIGNMAWSPKGDLLAYELNEVYGTQVARPRLWLARTDGSDIALMYGRSQETGSYPSWAPDGRRVAFYENEQRVIGIFDFTSRLLAVPAQIDAPVSWAPDGEALAYTDRGGEGGALSVIKIAAVSDMIARALPAERGFDASPAWSPAGDWIAFVRVAGTDSGVWLVRPDGSESHPINRDSGWTYSPPVWAPDGSALAFSRRPTRVGPTVGESEVWIAPLTSKPYQLSLRGRVTDWIP